MLIEFYKHLIIFGVLGYLSNSTNFEIPERNNSSKCLDGRGVMACVKNVLSISGSFDIRLERHSKKHRSFKHNSLNALYASTLQSITILHPISICIQIQI